ncbi:DUF4435 domain-containing protein [Paraburkholderia tropica]|uniref:DUF4435 domain-containing protein n=1 Tax=Paraburkholderia tropica TaxID=92647 RepID=A0AAQ1JYN0_9BURK|nr:DUF4435 domain-containing protein [Paraburkholderia tropica]SEK15486.1 Protein of unknown function [Paraburkholderia tropica]
MTRAAFKGVLLVLEGPTDSIFWRNKIAKDQCQITISGSKATSVSVTKILDAAGFDGFVVIVDDDYDHFLGSDYDSVNLVATETNDLETLLGSSPALQKILEEHLVGDHASEHDIETAELTQKVKTIATVFGKLRYVNRKHSLNVPFDKLSPWKYVDQQSVELNTHNLCLDFSALCGVSVEQVEVWLEDAPAEPVWNVIQGHDFTCLLAIALKGRTRTGCNESTICSSLRLAYEWAWFKATSLVQRIERWEHGQGRTLLMQ